MRKLISYIASSLDGKIAKPDGDVSWLEAVPNPDKQDYGYTAFYDSIDTTIMGNGTYREILNFDIPFPYLDKKNYVVTRNAKNVRDENVVFVSENVSDFFTSLKKGTGTDIWLVGGGELNTLFLNAGLLDELRVYVMPIVLGDGIPLFSDKAKEQQLKLESSCIFTSGVVELIYKPT